MLLVRGDSEDKYNMSMRILPAITSTSPDWRKKIEEVRQLGLREIALFPTCLNLKQRAELYSLLKETKVEKIPFVHLRSDMAKKELDYLAKNYGTAVFNVHSKKEHLYPDGYKKYRDIIYLESAYWPFDEKEIKELAGICLDLAHLENARIFKKEMYRDNIKMIEKYGCGCSHISPAKNFPVLRREEKPDKKHPHLMKALSELNYLKRYPISYFGNFSALEMENSIEEQLKAKDYIVKLLAHQ